MWRLDCASQNYAWGKTGEESAVAQLMVSEGRGRFEIDGEQQYAELWMGTHPNGPSRLKVQNPNSPRAVGKGPFLIELLETHPEYLGRAGSPEGDLPFMFKVLSIAKALSIQAHPDKATAERVYATRPDLYKDDNHKPEMAVALTKFEGLCGFRPFEEIVYALHMYPELRSLVSMSAVKRVCDVPKGLDEQMQALRLLFGSYIKAKPNAVQNQIKALLSRLRDEALRARGVSASGSEELEGEVRGAGGDDVSADEETTDHEHEHDDDMLSEDIFGRNDPKRLEKLAAFKREDTYVRTLILRLNEEYPGDIGIMMPLLLNYMRMSPGESFFMAANEPHAYLSGDLLEVMARSDNVVRVALTPKYRDVPLLCEILSYKTGPPPLVPPVPMDASRVRYTPPIEDFEMEEVRLTAGQKYSLPPADVPQLVLCLEGAGFASGDDDLPQRMWAGVTFFAKAHAQICFEAIPIDDEAWTETKGGAGVQGLRVVLAHTNTHWSLSGVLPT